MKILEILKSPQVHCQWWCDKRYDGQQEGNWIRINPKSGNIVGTIIHEIAHMVHPDLTEEEIIQLEEKALKRLNKRQAVAIITAFTKKARM